MSTLKRTPLFDLYKEHGAKTIDFGGWDLPVQFSSIKEEHEAVRTKAGLFDVSHMGEIEVKGEKALEFLQLVMTNDLANMEAGQAKYTLMCYEDGGTIDDLLVYKRNDEDYLLVVNAANTEKDASWLESHIIDGVELVNVSDHVAQLAIQGPLAESVLQRLTNEDLSKIGFFRFKDNADVAGVKALVSRSGYTGEDGFEIYCEEKDAAKLWAAILEEGKNGEVFPCGLGARDTLRFEAKLPLYGQELSKEISPLEAGLGFAVKVDKEADFIGKAALQKQKAEGTTRKLVGLEMLDKGIPRTGYEVFVDDNQVGVITTGTQSPTLKKNIGLAIIDKEFTAIDTEVEVQVRKKRLKAKVIQTPFYKRQK
ncbi:MAG: glycine cleavage system aminomethyltransferase GcvT [Bacillaceae bacterium]|uniref:Aminomethyltransferase n=1 Tax=Alkalihalobacterium chitinilyticum TaxID=2980103 RepID=A0ABT5VCR8_9BACI|nr:glycine cleavage system aminomethyltransferase GcvT [Alkalihalobacterium chitinilyticum]MDE5412273.1 glycine cleavage system aminomethyltransferase GcvT [Alkalihalobacterium chitinilyticum]MEB1806569.1 glycine cleavage system aminomethyltransferase GcvT [Bacillaceae bacterium]